MLDLKFVLSHLDETQKGLLLRGQAFDLSPLLALNDKRKALQSEFDQLRAKQNEASKTIQALQKNKQSTDEIIEQMQSIAKHLKSIGPALTEIEHELEKQLLFIPNLPHASVPQGAESVDNVLMRTWGEKPVFDFDPKQHGELGENLGILDFERASKIAGSRFAVLKGWGARLERALASFMLDLHTQEHGYLEILPPYLVNADSLLGTGQLPKFEEDLFKTQLGYYLIPTAEVPVTNLHRDEILKEEDLPLSYTSFTPCFRSEAGSYGKDVKGLIRQHQFHKVELVKFTTPETSWTEFEKLTLHAETVLQKLGLHYRVVALCTGDLGFSSAKTYDLEVWLPGQNAYREISSCSNFEDYQARRAKIRYKSKDGKNHLAHTLNGSGLAIGRTLIALLENYQQADGSIQIPKALQSYLGGIEKISAAT